MSTRYITQTICDVCEREFGTPEKAWMVLTAPNMGEDAPVFDFCTWDCLFKWVNTTEDEEVDTLDVPEGVVVDKSAEVAATAALASQLNQAMQQPRPAMSLADAIATGGLTPGLRVTQ